MRFNSWKWSKYQKNGKLSVNFPRYVFGKWRAVGKEKRNTFFLCLNRRFQVAIHFYLFVGQFFFFHSFYSKSCFPAKNHRFQSCENKLVFIFFSLAFGVNSIKLGDSSKIFLDHLILLIKMVLYRFLFLIASTIRLVAALYSRCMLRCKCFHSFHKTELDREN